MEKADCSNSLGLALQSILSTLTSDHNSKDTILNSLNAFCSLFRKYQPSCNSSTANSKCRQVNNDVVQEEEEEEDGPHDVPHCRSSLNSHVNGKTAKVSFLNIPGVKSKSSNITPPIASSSTEQDVTVSSDDLTEEVLGLNYHQIFSCLRIPLFHEAVEIRASTLRCFRYFILNDSIAKSFILNNIPILVCRSLDINLDNRAERLQALRLIRKLLVVYPSGFPSTLTNTITAISRDGIQEKDVMTRTCAATLAELCIRNPSIAVSTQGILSTITECILQPTQPIHITESLTGVLLYLLNDLSIRQFMYEDKYLQRFVCTFTDVYCPRPKSTLIHKNYTAHPTNAIGAGAGHNVAGARLVSDQRNGPLPGRKDFPPVRGRVGDRIKVAHGIATEAKQSIMANNAAADSDQNELRGSMYMASKRAVVTTLRAWPGLIYFCRFTDTSGSSAGLRTDQSANLFPRQIAIHAARGRESKQAPGHIFNNDSSSSDTSLDSTSLTVDAHLNSTAENATSLTSGHSTDIYGEKLNAIIDPNALDGESFVLSKGLHNSYTCQLNAIQSIIETLYMPNQDVLDLFFDLLNLPTPSQCDDFDTALMACSIIPERTNLRSSSISSSPLTLALASTSVIPASMFQEEWQIYDGFVASEGKSLIPPVGQCRNNLYNSYMSLLLYSLVSYGIIEALETAIIRMDSAESSIKASLLLGEILNMSSYLLPTSINGKCQSLPILMSTASSSDSSLHERTFATSALAFLNKVQTIRKQKPKYCSMYLEQLVKFSERQDSHLTAKKICKSLQASSHSGPSVARVLSPQSDRSPSASFECKSPEQRVLSRRQSFLSFGSSVVTSLVTACARPGHGASVKVDTEYDLILQLIIDSKVLTGDPSQYDWILISNILTLQFDWTLKLAQEEIKPFLDNLCHYFEPSSKLYSSHEAASDDSRIITLVSCDFVNFSIKYYDTTHYSFVFSNLLRLVNDIISCLTFIDPQVTSASSVSSTHLQNLSASSNKSTDVSFSFNKLMTTLSHGYFLMIGQMSSHETGRHLLEQVDWPKTFRVLIEKAQYDVYVKLILSSLDYTSGNKFSRSFLTYAMTETKDELSRIYATNFLRTLLRIGISDFSEWGVKLLLDALNDPSFPVSRAASEILLESLDVPCNLEKFIELDPIKLLWSRQEKCHNSALILIKFTSHQRGLEYLQCNEYLETLINLWSDLYNLKYVKITEDMLNDCLTQHFKSNSGSYGRKTERKYANPNCYLPPHLYSELCRTSQGVQILQKSDILTPLTKLLASPETSSELARIRVKASLWAIGHVASTELGFPLVKSSIVDITHLAETSSILSIRGTCFYVLGLVATHSSGIRALEEHDWIGCVNSVGEDCRFPGLSLPVSLRQLFTIPKVESDSALHFLHAVQPPVINCGLELHNESNCLLCSGRPGSTSTKPEIVRLRTEVRRLVALLGGTVTAKSAEVGLLNLKQRNPDGFQDICLYSEVIHQMSSYKFRLPARRFLQELFLDLNFDPLKDYAKITLATCKKRLEK